MVFMRTFMRTIMRTYISITCFIASSVMIDWREELKSFPLQLKRKPILTGFQIDILRIQTLTPLGRNLLCIPLLK